MTGAYEVVIVHEGLAGFANEVKEVLIDSTEKILSQSGAIAFREASSRDDLCEIKDQRHVVVLYLGNKAGSASQVVNSILHTALENSISVLPVVRKSDPGSYFLIHYFPNFERYWKKEDRVN